MNKLQLLINYSVNMKLKTIIILTLTVLSVVSISSCKVSQKKLEKQRLDSLLTRSKVELNSLLSDTCTKTLDEKEKTLATIKSYQLRNLEVGELINKTEKKLIGEKKAELEKEEVERQKKHNEELELNKVKKITKTLSEKLENNFQEIAEAENNSQADKLIRETLEYFITDQANVLIIIGEFNGEKDYEKPTTIIKYLNLIKDTRKSINKIEKIHYQNDKIKLLELKRK